MKRLFLSTLIALFALPNLALSADEVVNYYGLVLIPVEFKPVSGSEIIIQDMPRVRSQGGLPACYAFAVATLFDKAYCDDKNMSPCSEADNSVKASPLDITRFNKDVEKGKDGRDRFAYEGLSLEGGGVAFNLENTIKSSSVAKESCMPFDNLVVKVNDPKEAARIESDNWQRFQNAYKVYKEKSKTCISCGLEYATAIGEDFRRQFNLKTSNKEILEAFAADSYQLFLDKLLIPDGCWDFDKTLGLSHKWTHKVFPERPAKGNYQSYINQIKATLTKKRPIGMSFCTQTPLTVKSTQECDNLTINGIKDGQGHAIVIKGYRKVCNSKNVCRESLQVQNSWGQGWQDSNNDGWVDAKELLDRTFYESEKLTWLEKRKNVD